MRISDWSSDVCSSDLSRPPGRRAATGPRRPGKIPHSPRKLTTDMAEQTPPPSASGVDAPEVTRKKQRRISWIWLVPVVALLAGLSLVIRTWMEIGPEVSIEFNTAEGIEVGKTQVRYKDVVVGTVHNIHFNDDRSKVIVQAQLAKEAAGPAPE